MTGICMWCGKETPENKAPYMCVTCRELFEIVEQDRKLIKRMLEHLEES